MSTDSAPTERRRLSPSPSPRPAVPGPPAAASGTREPAAPRATAKDRPLTAFDFFPAQGPQETGLAPFFDALRAGRLRTTQCPRDGETMWPPRVVCPRCHGTELQWVDLPMTGQLYAFSAVLLGAPMGMEDDVPFAVGLVDLDGSPLRLFGRIVGRRWDALAIGDAVRVEPFDLGDGRVFYRFRAAVAP